MIQFSETIKGPTCINHGQDWQYFKVVPIITVLLVIIALLISLLLLSGMMHPLLIHVDMLTSGDEWPPPLMGI